MSIGPIPPPLRDLLFRKRRPRTVLLYDLRTKVQKHLVDVRPPSGTGLVVRLLTPRLSQLESSSSGHDTVVFHVGFVPDHDERDVFVVFDADDLFAQLGELVEGVHVADAEDEEEALSLFHVQFAHGGELLGASCIETGRVTLSAKTGGDLAIGFIRLCPYI